MPRRAFQFKQMMVEGCLISCAKEPPLLLAAHSEHIHDFFASYFWAQEHDGRSNY